MPQRRNKRLERLRVTGKNAPPYQLPQFAVTFPLRLVKELVLGRLLREAGVCRAIVRDIDGFIAGQRRLHVNDPRLDLRLSVVTDLCKGGMCTRAVYVPVVLVN